MNSIFSFIFYIAILCASIRTFEVKLETGLIFNTKFEKLDEISEHYGEKECPFCMVACPATSEREVLINEYASATQKSVFARYLYGKEERAVDMKVDICDKPFSRPMIIYDQENKTHEIGYELYYRELKKNMECKRFDNFKEITEEYTENLKNFSITKSELQKKTITKDGYENVEKMVDIGTKFEFSYGRSLVFYWISVLSFKLNPPANQIRVYLNSDIVNDYNLEKECDNYKLGNKFYTSKFYPFSSEVYGSIVKTPLVPLKYLHTKAGKLAGCTQLNFVPVWTNVEKRLKLIDRYLYELYRHFNPNLNMFFGVSGKQIKKVFIQDDIAKDQTEEKDEPSKGKNETTEEKDISMPEILYRVVEYTISFNPITHQKLVIFIHNERNGVSKDKRLCKEGQVFDLEVSWNEEKEDGIFSYACSTDNQMLIDLGVYDSRPTQLYSDLKLSELNLRFTNDDTKLQLLEYIKKDLEKKAEDEGKQPQEEGKQPEEEGKEPQEEGKEPQEEGKQPQEEGKQPQEEGKQPQEEGKQPQEEGKQPQEEGKQP